MSKIIETLKEKNIAVGWLYSYIHFITEVVCFYFLSKVTNGSYIIWFIPFMYDALAFVPQGLIGIFCDKYPKFNIAIMGLAFLFLSVFMQFTISFNLILNLIVLCIGNCMIHIAGAECTLRNSEGKLAHSAIFVAGGSFGVITGKLMSQFSIPYWSMFILILTMIPFIILANTYNTKESYTENACQKFNYANLNIAPLAIIVIATLVVIVRGYMGYGIPTAWNKTTLQTVFLFVIMGIRKSIRRNIIR